MENKLKIKRIIYFILVLTIVIFIIIKFLSFLPNSIEGNRNVEIQKDSLFFDSKDSTYWIYKGDNTFEKVDSLNN